jgi:hypothetical protein
MAEPRLEAGRGFAPPGGKKVRVDGTQFAASARKFKKVAPGSHLREQRRRCPPNPALLLFPRYPRIRSRSNSARCGESFAVPRSEWLALC